NSTSPKRGAQPWCVSARARLVEWARLVEMAIDVRGGAAERRGDEYEVEPGADAQRCHDLAAAGAPGGVGQDEEGDIATELSAEVGHDFPRQLEVPEAVQSEERCRRVAGAATEAGLQGNAFDQPDRRSESSAGALLKQRRGLDDQVVLPRGKVWPIGGQR